MNLVLGVVVLIAIVLAITGGLVEGLQFLLWVGIVLAVIAAILWLLRVIGGRRTSV